MAPSVERCHKAQPEEAWCLLPSLESDVHVSIDGKYTHQFSKSNTTSLPTRCGSITSARCASAPSRFSLAREDRLPGWFASVGRRMPLTSCNFSKGNKEHSIEGRLLLTRRACAYLPIPGSPPADPNHELLVASETRANPGVWPRALLTRGSNQPRATWNLMTAIGAGRCLNEGVDIISRTLPISDFAVARGLR